MLWMLWTTLALASGDSQGLPADSDCGHRPPISVSASPANQEAGKPVVLSGSVARGGSECPSEWGYTLRSGDGVGFSGQSGGCGWGPSYDHVYKEPGVYTVSFTVRYPCIALSDWLINTWSGSATTTTTVTIREPGTPAPNMNLGNEDEKHGCDTNPTWGADYALLAFLGWLLASLWRREETG